MTIASLEQNRSRIAVAHRGDLWNLAISNADFQHADLYVSADDFYDLLHRAGVSADELKRREPVTLAVQREMWTQAQVADRRALLEDGTYQADVLDALLQCFDANEMSA